jgi:predicted PurR-regulated permease PerM
MGTFSRIFTFFTLLVISFYMMLDRPNLYKKASWFTRDAKQIQDFKTFIDSLEEQLGGWVRAQLVLMLVIGLITFGVLTLIGVPYALPLAILAAALEIIPNIGPTIAAIPAITLAYIYFGPAWAAFTAVCYIGIQQVENHIIVPKIMKDNVDVNPLVAIVTIIVGLEVGGVIGAILSIPTYIIFRTVYSIWFKNKVRGPLSTSG